MTFLIGGDARNPRPWPEAHGDWTCDECGHANLGRDRNCAAVTGERDGLEDVFGQPLKEFCSAPRGGKQRSRGPQDVMDLNPTATDFERARRHDRTPQRASRKGLSW